MNFFLHLFITVVVVVVDDDDDAFVLALETKS